MICHVKNNGPIQLPGEQWRPIDGFPGYEISDHGRVKNTRNPDHHWICALSTKKTGHKLAILRRDGLPFGKHVHRLVAMAFLPNPHGFPVVHHKDTDPTNNAKGNLEWTTQRDNIAKSMAIRGNWLQENCPKRTKRIVRVHPETGEAIAFESITSAGTALNVETVKAGGVARPARFFSANISTACNQPKIAYGYRWFSHRKWLKEKRATNGNGQAFVV